MNKNALLSVFDSVSNSVPATEDEYMGEDGLLHCSVCHDPIQTEVELFGQKRIVRCICSCITKEREEYAEYEKRRDRERARNVCFQDAEMAKWTFENDDKKNDKLSTAMMNYVENFSEFRKNSKGLMLYGTVGTGKSYLAACIANELIDRDYSVIMIDVTSFTNKLQGKFEDKQDYINSLNRYSLLIIDDLGAERKTEFMQEMVYNIVNTRYNSGLPMIVTTNLSAEEMKNPGNLQLTRIYDRVLERCHPIKVEGSSRRRENLKNGFADTQRLLGL